jgi:GNAT superfamily N-acetyltransferase
MIIRPYTRADAAAVVDLVNAASPRSLGIRSAAVDGAGNVRLSRYVPPSSEKIVAVQACDRPVGYAYLWSSDQHILHTMGGAVHPDAWGQGIGAQLAGWAMERAAELARGAPHGVKAVLQTNLFADERAAIALFTRLGFVQVREWVHMAIELDTPPQPPALPGALSIRPMDLDNDWDTVGPAMDAAFADHWGTVALGPGETSAEDDDDDSPEADAPEDDSYSNAPGVCFIVLEGDTVVGGILCNAKLVERDDTGRVGSMFVRPAYRRQGIGSALMLTAFEAFWRRGIRRIILDTDARSFTAAPSFYARLGMRPYRHEFLYEKEVRPGREARRLEM